MCWQTSQLVRAELVICGPDKLLWSPSHWHSQQYVVDQRPHPTLPSVVLGDRDSLLQPDRQLRRRKPTCARKWHALVMDLRRCRERL
jgi:hypothetical protein